MLSQQLLNYTLTASENIKILFPGETGADDFDPKIIIGANKTLPQAADPNVNIFVKWDKN